MSKFKVEIVETYRRYVEVEAQDEDAAGDDITNKIEEGLIDLPRDGEDYKYDRELFVSEICNEKIKEYSEKELYKEYGYLMDQEHGADLELLIDIMKCNGINVERKNGKFYVLNKWLEENRKLWQTNRKNC